MKKLSKLNESLWADVQNQASGNVIKKEDEFNPEYIDFGPDTTVYWATELLEINGRRRFKFDEVKDFNKNGWRLPTEKEVKQVDFDNRLEKMSTHKDSTYLQFPEGTITVKVQDPSCFHMWMWTKSGYENYTSRADAYGYDYYKFEICDYNKETARLCVFLVKDKKMNESLWAEVQSQASGDTYKKEEGAVNQLKSLKELYEYIKDNYGPEPRIYLSFANLEISLGVDYFANTYRATQIKISLNWYNDTKTLYIYGSKSVIDDLSKHYNLKQISDHYKLEFENEELKNSMVLDVMDIMIDNISQNKYIESTFHKKEVSESLWADVQNQASGSAVKKEDDLDNLGIERFCEYLKEHYECNDNSDKGDIWIHTLNGTPLLNITLFYSLGSFSYIYCTSDEIAIKDSTIDTLNCKRELKKRYTISSNGHSTAITPKDKSVPVTNSFKVDVLDFLLDIVEKSGFDQQIKKKV